MKQFEHRETSWNFGSSKECRSIFVCKPLICSRRNCTAFSRSNWSDRFLSYRHTTINEEIWGRSFSKATPKNISRVSRAMGMPGSLRGFEALLKWDHHRSPISPGNGHPSPGAYSPEDSAMALRVLVTGSTGYEPWHSKTSGYKFTIWPTWSKKFQRSNTNSKASKWFRGIGCTKFDTFRYAPHTHTHILPLRDNILLYIGMYETWEKVLLCKVWVS